MREYTTIDGETIYAERRRYGNRVFTWLYLKRSGEFLSFGDPWQGRIRKTELRHALSLMRIAHDA